MKKIFVLAAISIISAMAVNQASAQYYDRGYRDIRHDRADIYNDRMRAERLERERRAAAYYGNRGAYRYDTRQERRVDRDIRHDRRDIRQDRRGRY
jgi:hypothetical protein